MNAAAALFALLTALMSATRAAVELKAVEPLTGFYAQRGALVIAQNALYLAGAVLLIAAARLGRGRHIPDFKRSARALGALLLAAGAILGISEGVLLCLDTVDYTGGASDVTLMLLIARAAGIAAAAAMIVTALPLVRAARFGGGAWGCAVCALWMAVEVVARFMAYPTIASISGQTLEVVALCMGALFWLAHARVTSGGSLAASPRKARMWAFLFAFFAISLCVGQLAGTFAGGSAVHMEPARQAALLVLGVYAAAWGLSIRVVNAPDGAREP